MRKTIAVVVSAALCAGTALAYSSASYKREGLLAQFARMVRFVRHAPDATTPPRPGASALDFPRRAW